MDSLAAAAGMVGYDKGPLTNKAVCVIIVCGNLWDIDNRHKKEIAVTCDEFS